MLQIEKGAQSDLLQNLFLFSGQKSISLGLIPIHGALPAEKHLKLLKEKLASFGIKLETDIAGVSNDGCSVMMKLGTLIMNIQVLCQSHGGHLAVTDVLYRKKGDDEMDSGFDSGEEDDNDDVESEAEEEEVALAGPSAGDTAATPSTQGMVTIAFFVYLPLPLTVSLYP